MTNWIKYDRENPPETAVDYLVTDGRSFGIGMMLINGGRPFFSTGEEVCFCDPDITHYAEIDLPGRYYEIVPVETIAAALPTDELVRQLRSKEGVTAHVVDVESMYQIWTDRNKTPLQKGPAIILEIID